jgi:hypothetical protein
MFDIFGFGKRVDNLKAEMAQLGDFFLGEAKTKFLRKFRYQDILRKSEENSTEFFIEYHS